MILSPIYCYEFFLSPELAVLLIGGAAIDYNIKDPNPVVVSADALVPCYKTASISVNLNEKPTVATVGRTRIVALCTPWW
jgi:hypothetical protein